jgi:hypothetical protein
MGSVLESDLYLKPGRVLYDAMDQPFGFQDRQQAAVPSAKPVILASVGLPAMQRPLLG